MLDAKSSFLNHHDTFDCSLTASISCVTVQYCS